MNEPTKTMIEARELRIDNLVNFGNKIVKIESIDKYYLLLEYCERKTVYELIKKKEEEGLRHSSQTLIPLAPYLQ